MVGPFKVSQSEMSAFALIGEINHRMPGCFYLIGGWAFDVWAGMKSRDHSDVDLLCKSEMIDTLVSELLRLGGVFKRKAATTRVVVHGIMFSIFEDPEDEPIPFEERYCVVSSFGIDIPALDALLLLSSKEDLKYRFSVDFYLKKDIHDISLLRMLMK
jgi:hypothetical protein